LKILYKYPRTLHLPWSEGKGDDDKILTSIDHFQGKDIIISVKLDGECSSLYPNYFHVRSLDSANHESQTWLKNFHNSFKHLIPENYRICGENLFAKHSIHYHNLTSYFQVFSIWNNDICLDWKDTECFCMKLNLQIVPVLYKGQFSEDMLKTIAKRKEHENDEMEGYVVRIAESFSYNEFSLSVAKFVRKNHVQTDEHWKDKKVIKNNLKIKEL